MVNMPPDVYIRDAVGDFGNPGTGDLSMSPDIIVRQNPVSDAQKTFGNDSGNATSNTLSQEIEPGKDHFIYVRLLNRGGSDAYNVQVSVFISPPSTLITPQLWTDIGNAIIACVPQGNMLTVSPAIKFPASQLSVPFSPHYCFTAIAQSKGYTDSGPLGPGGPDLGDFDAYIQFVNQINNMAHKNFEIISGPPPNVPLADGGGIGFHQLPFIIPGPVDSARTFAIETLGSLPLGSEVQLRLPNTLKQQLNVQLVTGLPSGTTIGIPLPGAQQTKIGEGVLGMGSRAQCAMEIKVPGDTYWKPGTWEFAIRQIYQGNEVGRLTWHFGQPMQI